MSTVASEQDIVAYLQETFGTDTFLQQATADPFPTLWVDKSRLVDVLYHLKHEVPAPYTFLYDISAIDERSRANREGQPQADFTVFYHVLSFERNNDVRLKVALEGEFPTVPTISHLWYNANWYEREVYDMFGITFEGHPYMRRILMPGYWQGHPLRKEHPARGTEIGPFTLPDDEQEHQEEYLKFNPEEWGMKRQKDDADFMFLNVGPQHPGTHGVLRTVLQLDGEDIVDAVPEIGFHHRGAEKMAERQSWHTYIPYTDRVEYLAGTNNNLPYVLALEQLGGIEVPDRVKYIRVMLCELYRISSHLVWYGTFVQDIGHFSGVFYMFSDREKVLEIIEAICGDRMHPNWFRIGGVAQDLPSGWQKMVQDFLDSFPKKLKEYDKMLVRNRVFRDRTKGIGIYNTKEAIEWGVTGPGLRATGYQWDFRKERPYSGYEQFDFNVPVGENGDAFDRAIVRIEEMRESLRIIQQCVDNMPAGEHKSRHQLTTPPLKDNTMHDIETLIDHFMGVSWGPLFPAGESMVSIEAPKGNNGYYLVSDGSTNSYRTRIRTPCFPHLQMLPYISRGYTIADMLAILGSIDYVLSDVDR